jgi:uncharacterized membrane protein
MLIAVSFFEFLMRSIGFTISADEIPILKIQLSSKVFLKFVSFLNELSQITYLFKKRKINFLNQNVLLIWMLLILVKKYVE